MKFKTLLLASVAMLSFNAMADVAGADSVTTTAGTDSLTIDDFSCYPGDTVTVSVNFKNATGYAALQCDYIFDSDYLNPIQHYDDVMGDTVWFSHGSRLALSYSLAGNNPDGNSMVRMVIFHLQNKQIAAGSGQIVTFSLAVGKDITPGVYDGHIGGHIKYSTGIVGGVGDGEGPATNFKVTVLDPNPTSVAEVDAAKAVKCVNYYNLAGQQSVTPFDGINVVETIYTDGSKAVAKQILK